ncbi:MAG: tryptophan synthase subunit alpha, partial [Clostridiales bacterium]|nr:tryptophan synthase subunit alpha [Clostridiales bacterium]
MNRIEKRLAALQEKNEKAFITYITAGLPDMERCGGLIHALEEAGLDILELGVPFSDPVADGPVIQDASYRS